MSILCNKTAIGSENIGKQCVSIESTVKLLLVLSIVLPVIVGGGGRQ